MKKFIVIACIAMLIGCKKDPQEPPKELGCDGRYGYLEVFSTVKSHIYIDGEYILTTKTDTIFSIPAPLGVHTVSFKHWFAGGKDTGWCKYAIGSCEALSVFVSDTIFLVP